MNPVFLTLPLQLLSLNAAFRQDRHDRERRAHEARGLTRSACWSSRPRIQGALGQGARLVVTMVRVGPGELDDDNLAGACKSVRDGVADAIGVRDNDPRVRWQYGQRRGAKRGRWLPPHYAVEITIGEVSP